MSSICASPKVLTYTKHKYILQTYTNRDSQCYAILSPMSFGILDWFFPTGVVFIFETFVFGEAFYFKEWMFSFYTFTPIFRQTLRPFLCGNVFFFFLDYLENSWLWPIFFSSSFWLYHLFTAYSLSCFSHLDLLSLLSVSWFIIFFSGSRPVCQACWSVCACVCCVRDFSLYLSISILLPSHFSYYFNSISKLSLDLITFFCYLLSIFLILPFIIIIILLFFWSRIHLIFSLARCPLLLQIFFFLLYICRPRSGLIPSDWSFFLLLKKNSQQTNKK